MFKKLETVKILIFIWTSLQYQAVKMRSDHQAKCIITNSSFLMLNHKKESDTVTLTYKNIDEIVDSYLFIH